MVFIDGLEGLNLKGSATLHKSEKSNSLFSKGWINDDFAFIRVNGLNERILKKLSEWKVIVLDGLESWFLNGWIRFDNYTLSYFYQF